MRLMRGRTPEQRAVRLVDLAGTDQAANAAAHDWRSYEEPLPQVLAMLAASRQGAFYDVGANTGYYSVLIGRLGLASPVRCFEAVPSIARLCQANLTANQLSVQPTVQAVGAAIGTVDLYLPPSTHGLVETSASLLEDFKETVAQKLRVAITTLDAAHEAFGGEDVGLVKVDVEGAEDQVLEGASALTGRCRPYLTVELLPRSNWEAVDRYLRTHDYVAVPISSRRVFVTTSRTAFHPDAHNQLLVPGELADDVMRMLASLDDDRTVEDSLQREDPLKALTIDAEVDRLSYAAWVEAVEVLRREFAPGAPRGTPLAGLFRSAVDVRYRQELGHVYASTSWRVTRPLRDLKQTLDRKKRR